VRTGTGTIRGFKGDPSLTVIALDRNGGRVNLVADPALVEKLLANFGVRERDDYTSMVSIVNLVARWTEDNAGVLVDLVPLTN
jgi:hypothetical protein